MESVLWNQCMESAVYGISALSTITPAEDIVQAIELCPNMQTLCLAGNTLGVEASQSISTALQSRPTLKVVKLSDI